MANFCKATAGEHDDKLLYLYTGSLKPGGPGDGSFFLHVLHLLVELFHLVHVVTNRFGMPQRSMGDMLILV